MELEELIGLAEMVRVAKMNELKARRKLIDTEETLEVVRANVLAQAYRDGAIDGKNAETRKQQEIAFTASNDEFAGVIYSVSIAQQEADAAVAELAGIEARYGLVKAWLYSQARVV